jgi:hypothetical protein
LRGLAFKKTSYDLDLTIFPALPICLAIKCKSQLWKRTKGGTHQKITNSFSTNAQYPPPPPVHEAYMRSLSKQRRNLTFKKQDMIWRSNYFSHCAN